MLLTLTAAPAWGTQAHGAPEGLFVHQFSHLFFIFAMGILIYWLRSRDLVRQAAWRYIQYAGCFFILWSADAFFVHLLDEQYQWIHVTRVSGWQIRIVAPGGPQWLPVLYYMIKLDHLLCVPGLIFLYQGLRHLTKTDDAADPKREIGS